jgi:hypothetical protein
MRRKANAGKNEKSEDRSRKTEVGRQKFESTSELPAANS